jgi:Resolvase, N terminal domain
MFIGYGRTSTIEQLAGLQAQIRDLKAAGAEKLFSENVSSARATRGEAAEELGISIRSVFRILRTRTAGHADSDTSASQRIIEGWQSRPLNFGTQRIGILTISDAAIRHQKRPRAAAHPAAAPAV